MSKKQFVLMAAACLLLVPASWGSTVVVGHCKSGLVSFSTIGDAVTAVPSGSTIYVCPGTYQEQVEITGKKLALIGVQASGADNPVIVPPAGGLVQNAPSLTGANPIAAQIWVHDVDATVTGLVNISNLTLDAAGNNISCGPSPVGIVYQNASGTIAHVVTRNQMTAPGTTGCQSGFGILVQSGPGTSGSTPLIANVTVSGSTVHDFQKNGIAGQGDGTTLTAAGNTVLGLGPTTGAAQNGIEIAFGHATGKITGNSVADFNFSPGTVGASGILLFDATGVTVSGNTVANSQYGIAIAESGATNGDTNTVTSNKVFGTHLFDGIDVCSDHNTVKTNTVNSSDESGIHIDDSCGGPNTGNTITGNIINEACAGILTGTSLPGANLISSNTFFNVGNTVLGGDVCTTTVLNANFASMNLKAHSVFVP